MYSLGGLEPYDQGQKGRFQNPIVPGEFTLKNNSSVVSVWEGLETRGNVGINSKTKKNKYGEKFKKISPSFSQRSKFMKLVSFKKYTLIFCVPFPYGEL